MASVSAVLGANDGVSELTERVPCGAETLSAGAVLLVEAE